MISLKKLAADGLIKLTDARRKYTIDGVQRLEAIYRIPITPEFLRTFGFRP